MGKDGAYWVEKLNLQPHPDGGYYRQSYRSDLLLTGQALPAEFIGPRVASTAIYFLLGEKDFSAFHRLRSDELCHFYLGALILANKVCPISPPTFYRSLINITPLLVLQ